MKTISPAKYQRIIDISIFFLSLIILTGAAVRLTEAGLGCEDWPTCNDGSPTPDWEIHGLIEFGNRLLSGVVAVAVAIAVLNAYKRRPRNNSLIFWAWGLVVGVVAQIILGGITVLLDLHPSIVGLHFILSMVLLWNAVVLREKNKTNTQKFIASSKLKNISKVNLGLATIVIMTGVLVTGTGPNGGDSRAERLSFSLQSISRVHGLAVWLLLISTVVLLLQLRKSQGFKTHINLYMLLIVLQGSLGYLQYNQGVPPQLVAIHICGAIAIWLLSLFIFFIINPVKHKETGSL